MGGRKTSNFFKNFARNMTFIFHGNLL